MNDSFDSQSYFDQEPQAGFSTPSRSGEGSAGETGRTIIADLVLAKIAGTAIAEGRGIHLLQSAEGSPCGPAHAIPEDPSCGIEVQTADGVTVTVRLVVDYGAPIGELADKLREEIANRLNRLTGMAVKEVNIYVNDIFFHEPDPAGGDATSGSDTFTGEPVSDRSSSRYPGILTGRLTDRDD